MQPTSEQRDLQYRAATEDIQNLYASPEAGEILLNVATSNRIPEESYRTYAVTVGDVILGFYPKTELPQLLQSNLNLSTEQSASIAHELEEFLAPVPETSTTPSEAQEKESENGQQEQPLQQNIAQLSKSAPKPQSESQQNPKAISALRTMQRDADRIHGYGAYRRKYPTPEEANGQQNEGGSKGSLADMPQYEDNDKNQKGN